MNIPRFWETVARIGKSSIFSWLGKELYAPPKYRQVEKGP